MKHIFSKEEIKLSDQNKNRLVYCIPYLLYSIYETYSLMIIYRFLHKLNIHFLKDAEKFFTILLRFVRVKNFTRKLQNCLKFKINSTHFGYYDISVQNNMI